MDIKNIRKACTETLVMSILRQGTLHGYQIASEVETRSSGYFILKHATRYPILHRLEEQGFISGAWVLDDPKERPRRYYTLTAKGKKQQSQNSAQWRSFFKALSLLLPEGAP